MWQISLYGHCIILSIKDILNPIMEVMEVGVEVLEQMVTMSTLEFP